MEKTRTNTAAMACRNKIERLLDKKNGFSGSITVRGHTLEIIR
jgi:hypothetical protein